MSTARLHELCRPLELTSEKWYQRDMASLSSSVRARLFEVILALPAALRGPQRHSGLGLRKLHASGIWEMRAGLDLRLVFALMKGEAILTKVGSHDDGRRYLRGL
jgi:mRNA-degrading endonuclease YafQ of YafQ-DinJ toxin-antitoxin module